MVVLLKPIEMTAMMTKCSNKSSTVENYNFYCCLPSILFLRPTKHHMLTVTIHAFCSRILTTVSFFFPFFKIQKDFYVRVEQLGRRAKECRQIFWLCRKA
ncbi:hypothetical protein OUZ56_026695 [Daphnia magna]|uniref:Uncharacterized protein n=1 Tax=Daphnia magna TaxID=35525 RepID=A0ABQ9ZMI5_9CRUS|nr:hypothetical protein OUZ56_026695 [Daphnia magna]